MPINEESQNFEEFYKKLKSEKIKPIIEKEKRVFASRAQKFDKLKKMIEAKKTMDGPGI